jgi:hypothetical protein
VKMINWQPASTAPKDASYFAVLTISGNLEGWTYNQVRREWHVWSMPRFAVSVKTSTSTIRAWARWNELIDCVSATAPEDVT